MSMHHIKNVIVIALVTVGALPAVIAPEVASAATCPPSGSTASTSTQFGTIPDTPFTLSQDEFNIQPSSTQTLYLEGAGGTWGLCNLFQPSGVGVTAYPNATFNLPMPYHTWNSYTTISSTITETHGTAVGNFQWLYDVWLNGTAVSGNPTEVGIVTDRDISGSPCGTLLASNVTIGSQQFNVYNATACSSHTFYAFNPVTSQASTTASIKKALTWLHNNEGLSTTLPLEQIDGGWEIQNVQASGGGPSNTDFKVTRYSVTAN